MKITKQYKDGSQKVVIDPMEKMAVVMGLYGPLLKVHKQFPNK